MTFIGDVPYDIWLYITQFLPEATILSLYSVNRALFDISLNHRWRQAYLGRWRDSRTQKCLKSLPDPGLARRVRELELCPEGLIPFTLDGKNQFIHEFLSGVLPTNTSLVRRAVEKLQFRKPTSAQVMHTVLRLINNLTEVTTVRVEVSLYGQCTQVIRCISSGWGAFGSNLRCLNLDIVLEIFASALPPSLLLETLQELTITLSTAYRTTDAHALMHGVVVPFIDKHRFTLTSLSIDTWEFVNLTVIFGSLLHIPKLSKLSLSEVWLSLERTECSGIHRMLVAHSTSIQELVMHFRPSRCGYIGSADIAPTIWFSQQFLMTPLPRLKSLTMSPWYSTLLREDITRYVQQYSSTLTFLDLRRHHLRSCDIESLATMLSLTNKLRHLHISMRRLFIGTMELMCKALPGLEELSVADMTEFWGHVGDRQCANWSLTCFTLEFPQNSREFPKEYKLQLAMFLPSVEFFDGLTRDEYLAGL